MKWIAFTLMVGLVAASYAMAGETSENQILTDENNDRTEDVQTDDDQSQTTPANPDDIHCKAPETDESDKWFDRTHSYLSESLCKQAVRIDHFFGEYDDDGGDARSFLRIRNGVTWEYGEKTEISFTPRIRARLHLPNAYERFNLLFSDDLIDEDSISSNEETLRVNDDERENYETALRWMLSHTETLDFDFDIGLRSSEGIRAFTQVRMKKYHLVDNQSRVDFTQTLFWFDWEGFGTRTQFEYERLLAPNRLLRWTSAFTFSESSDGIDLLQRLTLFETISQRRGLSFGIGLVGFTRPVPTVEDYGFSIRYRKNFFRKWLFFELEPEAVWPLERDRNLTTRITMRIEIQLGEST